MVEAVVLFRELCEPVVVELLMFVGEVVQRSVVKVVMLLGELLELVMVEVIMLRGQAAKVVVGLAHRPLLTVAEGTRQRLIGGMKRVVGCRERGVERFTGRGLPGQEVIEGSEQLLMEGEVRRTVIVCVFGSIPCAWGSGFASASRRRRAGVQKGIEDCAASPDISAAWQCRSTGGRKDAATAAQRADPLIDDQIPALECSHRRRCLANASKSESQRCT